MHTKRVLVVRVVSVEMTLEEIDELPRPPRVPDVDALYRAAQIACAPGFRSKRAERIAGSTLRLLPPSRRAA